MLGSKFVKVLEIARILLENKVPLKIAQIIKKRSKIQLALDIRTLFLRIYTINIYLCDFQQISIKKNFYNKRLFKILNLNIVNLFINNIIN